MGKMDLWYGFACTALDLLAQNGHLCFIAQNNWTTSSGAKKMRNKVISDSKICQMLDFNDYMVFESASIQTMIMLFEKNSKQDDYSFDYRVLNANSKKQDMLDLLNKIKTPQTRFLEPKIVRTNYKDKLLTFSENDSIFEKIADGKVYLIQDEVTQGIIGNPDDAFKIKTFEDISFNQDELKFIHEFHTHTEKYTVDKTDVNIIYLSSKENPNLNIRASFKSI